MKTKLLSSIVAIALILIGSQQLVQADPCGMIPPIYTGDVAPISRIGLQKTYVFYKDGVETFVIRPGFRGNVDNFGMLIPFPTPPSIRKVNDNIFEQITNAVDPPEVVVDLRIMRRMRGRAFGGAPMAEAADQKMSLESLDRDQVVVLKEEAVGMYEVAVLAAGSADALKKWLEENKYKYPNGMEKVTNEYVAEGWCFVAVKTKVGSKTGVEPRAGQRRVNSNKPANSVFDGNVQGMGFRFETEKLVVPMRLSAFNDGELRNIVYLLTDGPRKIRAIPEEYVVRQIPGTQLYDNVTKPLPLRIIGGTEKDIPEWQRKNLPSQRDATPKNGVAKELFASDLLAVANGNLSLEHEETEKELLRIGEHFGLRGVEVDNDNAKALAKQRNATTEKGLDMLKNMTLSVVDGDFPREVLANQNLTFASFEMPKNRNTNLNYDAKQFGPGQKKDGILKVGYVDWNAVDRQIVSDNYRARTLLATILGLALIGMIVTCVKRPKVISLLVFALALSAGTAFAKQDKASDLVKQLKDSKTASAAIEAIVSLAKTNDDNRDDLVRRLVTVAKKDEHLPKRGWAIAALAQIGGTDVDEYLLNLHADEDQEKIVRTWAAAARVSMTRTLNGLIEKANLIAKFPALGRPIGLRIVEKMTAEAETSDPAQVIAVTQKVPQLQSALAPAIMAFGEEKLCNVMVHAEDTNVRRIAAGYLGSLAQQGKGKEVAAEVAKALKFDNEMDQVPWNGGALFLPGIQWGKEEARVVVGSLIRWNLWCDRKEKKQEMQQIHNNIRSLGLAKAAGYTSPGWNSVGAIAWLKAWGAAVGKDEIREILTEQDLMDRRKYADVLDELE